MSNLKTRQDMLKKIEKYIDFLANVPKDAANIIKNQLNVNYNSDISNIGYECFMLSGDKNYFVSRFLFFNRIHEYSFFCAQQCIENYLKACLKFSGGKPQDTHDLSALLEECKRIGHDAFIHSTRIKTIIERFKPFYELSRYPVQKKFMPRGQQYAIMHPDDIRPLDYFVYKIREIMPYPINMWDVLKIGNLILPASGEAIACFKKDNINFL